MRVLMTALFASAVLAAPAYAACGHQNVSLDQKQTVAQAPVETEEEAMSTSDAKLLVEDEAVKAEETE
jgi:hypothetical protein